MRNYDKAIAVMFFNRPEMLKRVLESIKEIRPDKLFLIQDGARKNNEYDKYLIEECRNMLTMIDWNCTIYKNFAEENMGLSLRARTGIDWVFNNVEEAIILEDDCVPNNSFFSFCSEMLDRYRLDLRIGIISGFNYFGKYDFQNFSYGFVKSGAIWGWATWSNRWEKYDFHMREINNQNIKSHLINGLESKRLGKRRYKTWLDLHNKIKNDNIVKTWAFQWGYTRNINSWYSIVPKYSLVQNIGVGANSTNSAKNLKLIPRREQKLFYTHITSMPSPYIHPKIIHCDNHYDTRYYKLIYPIILIRVFSKIERIIRKLIYS